VRIVVATDSFKGTLRASEACRIIADAIARRVPDAELVIKPMADGGEGTAEAMMAAGDGRWVPRAVMGPLPDMRVEAGFAWFDADRTAVVEMASASGLELLSPGQMNPLRTTTCGTGQLIRHAADYGAAEVLLAVGGSATVDGGVGAAAALGWQFLDSDGQPVPLGGGGLSWITRILPPQGLNLPPVRVLCDVENPLCGPQGAAKVYAPQKGADAAMVEQLEHGLEHLAELVAAQTGHRITDLPGAGAAGGLAAGAVAFMNGTIVSGIETVLAHSRLAEDLPFCDWVITGEGSFDEQSLQGKVVSGVACLARRFGVRVAVIAGQVRVRRSVYRAAGITAALACRTDDMTFDYAIGHAGDCLRAAADRFAAQWLDGPPAG